MTSLSFDFDAPAPVSTVPTLRQLTEQFGNERDAEMREGLRAPLLPHAGQPGRAYRYGGYGLNAHMLAFVAQAKHHGHTDPSLTPLGTDAGGRNLFDEVEVARFANEVICGIRSDRPTMTPERWALATQKARELGGKL